MCVLQNYTEVFPDLEGEIQGKEETEKVGGSETKNLNPGLDSSSAVQHLPGKRKVMSSISSTKNNNNNNLNPLCPVLGKLICGLGSGWEQNRETSVTAHAPSMGGDLSSDHPHPGKVSLSWQHPFIDTLTDYRFPGSLGNQEKGTAHSENGRKVMLW